MARAAMICSALLFPFVALLSPGTAAAQEPTRTFASAKWGVALEYPAAWSIDDDGDEVTIRSADGRTIAIGRIGSENASEPPPGRRASRPQCSTTTTTHGVRATICTDAASMTRRAVMVWKARDGVESRLAIRSQGRDASVFDAIVSSVRRYP